MTEETTKKFFPFFAEWELSLKMLSAEEKAEALDAIMAYGIRGERVVVKSERVAILMPWCEQKITEMNDVYEKRCEKNRENIKKRWDRIKAEKESAQKAEEPKQPQKSVRELDRESARRVFASYPKQAGGISMHVLEIWQRDKLRKKEAEIISAIEAWKASEQWIDAFGQYIPKFESFLEREIWRVKPPTNKDATTLSHSGEQRPKTAKEFKERGIKPTSEEWLNLTPEERRDWNLHEIDAEDEALERIMEEGLKGLKQ